MCLYLKHNYVNAIYSKGWKAQNTYVANLNWHIRFALLNLVGETLIAKFKALRL